MTINASNGADPPGSEGHPRQAANPATDEKLRVSRQRNLNGTGNPSADLAQGEACGTWLLN